MAFEYDGFKLAEKRVLKEKEQFFPAAQKALQDKLGAEWTIDIDWATLEKLTGDSGTNPRSKGTRSKLAFAIYETWLKKFGAEEVPKWDAAIVDALNGAVPGKKFVFTGQDDAPAGGGKFDLKISESAVVVSFHLAKVVIVYNGKDITAKIEKNL